MKMTFKEFMKTRRDEIPKICAYYVDNYVTMAQTAEHFGLSVAILKSVIKIAIIESIIPIELAKAIRDKAISGTHRHSQKATAALNYYNGLFAAREARKPGNLLLQLNLINFQIENFENYNISDEDGYSLETLESKKFWLQKELGLI